MGDRWEKQSRKPEQVEDNVKALGVSLEEADIVQMKKNTNKLLKNTMQHSQKMIWILPDVR